MQVFFLKFTIMLLILHISFNQKQYLKINDIINNQQLILFNEAATNRKQRFQIGFDNQRIQNIPNSINQNQPNRKQIQQITQNKQTDESAFQTNKIIDGFQAQTSSKHFQFLQLQQPSKLFQFKTNLKNYQIIKLKKLETVQNLTTNLYKKDRLLLKTQQNDLKSVSLGNQNYIKNGNFQNNLCPLGNTLCFWYQSQYNTSLIPNWLVYRNVEIGNGTLYNSNLNNSRVLQLVGDLPNCIYQNIASIPSGTFNLIYKYTARDSVPTNYSSFQVYVNNSLVQQLDQYDYLVHQHTTQITNYVNGSSIQVKFCGKSWTSTNKGAILISAQLIKIDQVRYKTQNTIVYNNTVKVTVQLSILQMINRIPGSRMIFKQILGFLINIDHLWLYIYHKRIYGNPMNTLLQSIHDLESEKWQFFSNQLIQNDIGVNLTRIRQKIDFKKKYSSTSFIEIQGSGNTFLTNNLQFFLINIILVIFMFMTGKTVHKLLIEYRISVFFRQFTFNIYIILMLLEGNIQSFSYYFVSDCIKLFSLDTLVKLSNIGTLVFFFIFIFLILAGYFLLLAYYPKQSKYVYDNCQVTKSAGFSLLISNGLFNMTLGMTHILFQNTPNLQLFLLGLIQSCYCLFMALIISNKNRVFKYKYLVWINILGSFIRILLIFTHMWFSRYNKDNVVTIQTIQQILIILYLALWITSFLIFVITLLKRLLLIKKRKLQQLDIKVSNDPKICEPQKKEQQIQKNLQQLNPKIQDQNLKTINKKTLQQKIKNMTQNKYHFIRYPRDVKSINKPQIDFDQMINFNEAVLRQQTNTMISFRQKFKNYNSPNKQNQQDRILKQKNNMKNEFFRISYSDDKNTNNSLKNDIYKLRMDRLKQKYLKRYKNGLNDKIINKINL